jgi:starch-binding outer membrane protein, SusD/RagB family
MKKRSKINVYHVVALVAIVFAISSCSDQFFNEQAGERITPDQHYKSEKDAEISLYGAFAPLRDVMPQMIMLDGMRSDQMVPGPGSDAYLEAINWQVFTLDNPFIDASVYYKVIINCNEVLANIDKVNELDRNFTPFLLNSFKGALYTLRGWSYFTLVKLYGEAAWIDGTYASLPEGRKQTFILKDAMIDTLINQLTPYVFDPSVGKEYTEYNFSPIMNTKAVLGELYLEKSDYLNAAKYLKLACESYTNQPDVYKVDKGYTKDAWKNIFIGAEYQETENMSYVSYNLYENQINPVPHWMMGSDKYLVKPAQSLIDSFKVQIQANKKPGDLYRGQGITYDTISTGEPYISKYSLDKGQEFSTDIVITRAADLHLELAEALNRTGNPNDEATALILLNAGFANEKSKPAAYSKWSGNLGIRGRAYLAPRVVPDSVSVVSGLDTTRVKLEGVARTEYIEDLIMGERAMELAFEGHRWFDLVRVANRRGKPEYLADKVAAKFTDPIMAEQVKAKLMNTANWYLPLKK